MATLPICRSPHKRNRDGNGEGLRIQIAQCLDTREQIANFYDENGISDKYPIEGKVRQNANRSHGSHRSKNVYFERIIVLEAYKIIM